jgi:prepilin-type N-terminal cleavage/methylation domain-containing protein
MGFHRAQSAYGQSVPSLAQSGFTILEMSIVIVILGFFFAAVAWLAVPLLRETHLTATQAKIDRVAKAIDFYASQNYRVPCPAKPDTSTPNFGSEQANTSAVTNVSTTCKATFGIVPFSTLGIPQDWVVDAWNNYMTYAVSPAFAQDTSVSFPVHARCRTADWENSPMQYEAGDTTTASPKYIEQYENKNPAKAMFCCPYPLADAPGTDLIILDVNGNSQLAQPGFPATNPRANTALAAALPDIPYPSPMVSNTLPANIDRPTAPVYVIVSHGPNGYGAWDVKTGVRDPLPAAATKAEKKNASNTTTFYEIPPLDRTSTAPGGSEMTFDDIVHWETQDMIFASQGKTCASP